MELWQDGSRVRECGNQYIIMPGRHHMPATVAHQATLCHTMPLTNTNARLPTYSVSLYIHIHCPHQTVLNFGVFFCNTIGLYEKVLLNQISQFLVENKIFQEAGIGLRLPHGPKVPTCPFYGSPDVMITTEGPIAMASS